jgi:hypothetical protein
MQIPHRWTTFSHCHSTAVSDPHVHWHAHSYGLCPQGSPTHPNGPGQTVIPDHASQRAPHAHWLKAGNASAHWPRVRRAHEPPCGGGQNLMPPHAYRSGRHARHVRAPQRGACERMCDCGARLRNLSGSQWGTWRSVLCWSGRCGTALSPSGVGSRCAASRRLPPASQGWHTRWQ